MVAGKVGRYSKYIRPISILSDFGIIAALALSLFTNLDLDFWIFIPYLILLWALVAYFTQFYKVYRYTTPVEIFAKIVRQHLIFLLVVIAYFPFEKSSIFSGKATIYFVILCTFLVTLSKFLLFYYLKKYRIVTGSNLRTAIIIGYTPEAIKLRDLFINRNDYGYNFLAFFSDKKSNNNIQGKISDVKDFVLKHKVNEIYCSLQEISNNQLKDLVLFADEYSTTIKFIPDTKEIFSKNLQVDYYELFPVLSLRKTPLHDPVTKVLKRIFDIAFSLFAIVFLLSWMVPILAVLIKLESRGPIFFKQGRPGINQQEFFCYKFRSMKINKTTETEASKNDPRVTKIGRFLRKTSIDEMPQFINVLMGEMSVVGPRPHLWSQNKAYGNRIKKYMIRHYVKPGITGLAQVKGYRGEIETDEDMVNRIRFDVFYIENWSLFLDIKIIIQTVINICKGEAKAY